MQTVGDVARREVFDRIEGRPTLKISGPQGGPIETGNYDLKKLSAEDSIDPHYSGRGRSRNWAGLN